MVNNVSGNRVSPCTRTVQGSALFISLIVLFMVLAISVTYSELTINQNKAVNSTINYATASETVMAGFDMTRVVLSTGHGNGWDDELTASYNNLATYSEGDAPLMVGTSTAGFQWARKIAYEDGWFITEIIDNDDGDGNILNDFDSKITIKVTSMLPDGSISEVQSLVRYLPPVYEPDTAIVTNGTLQLDGNATITGTNGTIYANDDVEIKGSAVVLQDVYSTGTVTGDEKVGGECYEGAAPTDVPGITPSDYANLKDYRMAADGKIYTAAGGLVGDATSGRVLGWDFITAGGKNEWKYNDNIVHNGTFYVEGGRDVDIAGSPGSIGVPWQLTLLATGNVKITGSPVMMPDETGVCIMAGKDISCAGNLTVLNGVVGCHEQMEISGSVNIQGNLVIEDAIDSAGSLVTLKPNAFDVAIGGSATINYNGGLTTFLEAGDPCLRIMGLKIIR
ncbi:MAG: hypothetical protein HY811_00030 [Planctomycetes bacterium]|nr:hypothetical protein [Planctomycetota bacterium]